MGAIGPGVRQGRKSGIIALCLALLLASGCALLPRSRTEWVPPEIRTYSIPWADAFPSDAVVDAEGAVWFTDRITHRIGRLDPETGEITAYPTPTPKSAPYGIIRTPDGFLWYAASRASRIGRVDPRTGGITEYVIPARGGPQMLAAQDGKIWFTLRESDRYGSLDPSTGEVWLDSVPAPAPYRAARPYSIAASPDGTLWMGLFGTNRLARIHPAERRLRIHALPDKRSQARRLTVDARGTVWYTDFRRSRLGRVDPATGAVREEISWRAPAEPYGLAVGPDGRIWWNESRHDLLVAFDPKTEDSFVVPIPGGHAVVRKIAVDSVRGRLWLPRSDAGTIARVDLGPN
jgi:virginiamycin B lyase